MNYGKLDAALAAAVASNEADSQPVLDVSVRIHSAPDEAECRLLAQLGVQGIEPGRKIVSARVKSADLDKLTGISCVQRVSLAQPLRPLA